jgi:O-antigen ligase
MNRELLDRGCERGILGLVLAILIAGPLALGASHPSGFLLVEGLTVPVLLLWGARLWISPRPQLLWPPICWAVLAFALYALGRYLTSDIEYVGRQELIRVLVYAFLFFAILNNLHRQGSTLIVSCTLVFLGMLIAGYALYQIIGRSYYVWNMPSSYPGRGSGTFICPNNLGGFLEMLLPLGLAYALVGRTKPVLRILLGYAALVILGGIVVTLSRGTWLSCVVALGCFFAVLLFHRRHRLPALALLVVLIGGGFYFFHTHAHLLTRLERIQDVVHDESSARDTRLAIWEGAIRLWRDNFWWGAGPGHFEFRFGPYRPQRVQENPELVHNDYLNTLADWGLAGAALIAAACVLLGMGIGRAWRYVAGGRNDLSGKAGSNRFAFLLGASMGLVALLVHSFVDFNMHIPANAILAVTLMALASSHLRFTTERYWLSARLGVRLLASAVLAAGLVFLGAQEWRGANECIWLARASRAPNYSPEQIELLKRAFAVEPMNARTAYAIGEALQIHAREGGDFYEDFGGADYRQLAAQAIEWLQRSQKLDSWNGFTLMRCGSCLDLLGRSDQAAAVLDHADQLEPNSYMTMNFLGLHYVEAGDYAAARTCFQRSQYLQWSDNPVPGAYLEIVHRKMIEAATNEVSATGLHANVATPRPSP